MAQIGVIIMMLKKKFDEEGIYPSLKKYADLGYRVMEVSQVSTTPENIAELKRACGDFGLTVGAMSAMLADPGQKGYENLTDNYGKIVGDCRALGCNYLRMGSMPGEYKDSAENYAKFAKDSDLMAKKLLDDGIKLYFHNHHGEFAMTPGKKVGLDIIKENSELLGFELDVHWIWRGGCDPVKKILEYRGRAQIIHLKDYRIALADIEAAKRGERQDIIQFAEVGEGTLDMPAIMKAGMDIGAEYFFIEQDSTYGRDVFESLRISKENLINMGYDLF